MFRNYIITAWRNLLKNRLVSLINIFGLTFGLASAVLAILYAMNELSYEKCHLKADRVSMVYLNGKFGSLNWVPNSFGPEGKAIKDMFPEIERYSIQRNTDGIVKFGDRIFNEEHIIFADSSFYSILTIPFVKGQPQFDPQSISLSEKMAAKYFGKVDPIGKLINLNCLGEKMVFTVTGIYKNFSSNTEIKPDIIAPFSVADRYKWNYNKYDGTNFQSLVLVKPGTDIKKLNVKIAANYKIPVPLPDINAFLMPLKQIHMRGSFENNYGKLLAFLIGGFFVLLTSCFNYVNLTNIVFSTRTKEIGIRKVNGASKLHVFIQFLCDNALATLIAFNLAIVVLIFALPWFNSLMDTNIIIDFSTDFVIIILILFFSTVIISGLLPALKYAALKPISLFQTSVNTITGKNRSLWLLTTIQFFLAVLFIQVMLVMNKQGQYLSDYNNLGYNSTDVICLPGYEWGSLEKVKTELLKNPAITNVSWGNSAPEMSMNMTSSWKDDKNTEQALRMTMEEDYIKIFSIKMVEGRFFSKEFASDKESAIVINKKTADILGYSDPVGRMMMANKKQFKIIGIIDSYQAVPPIFSKMPQIITLSKDQDNNLLIKIDPRNRKIAHEAIARLLQKINPDYPVDIKYHLEILLDTAKSYIAASNLTHLFFLLTIITSLIGLFALSMFISEKHRKDVCIRRICGATISNILPKLLKGIFYQVLMAICIATPIAILFSQKYLSVFPNHFSPGIKLFLEGGFLALMITMLTVSWQAWRAASRNPVESLRYE